MTLLQRFWPGLWRDIVLNRFIASSLIPKPFRAHILRLYGMRIGSASISPHVWFGSNKISIGDGTFVNYDCMFNTSAPIEIGDNCAIGMRVTFVTSSHEVGSATRRAGDAVSRPIVVKNGVWIGACAVILPGVTIGEGAIIAAGAVVSSDCKANTVYGGIPAKAIKNI
ncbi:DapH/DapD/GlmU-related protein [Rhodococcus sp. 5G237]